MSNFADIGGLALGPPLAGIIITVLPGILWLYVLAGVAAGAGVGIPFRASLGVAAGLAPEGARGEVLAAMFRLAGIGAALVRLPLTAALMGFAGVVLTTVSPAVPRMLRRLTR